MPMKPAAPPAVHSDERTRLAEVLDRFISGNRTISQFAGMLCGFLGSKDHCIGAIIDGWYDRDEFNVPALCRTFRSLPPEEQAMLQRCRLFLRSGLPYEWPDEPNLVQAGIGRAVLVLLGMVLLGHLLFAVAILFMGQWLAGSVLIAVSAGAGTAVVIGHRALRRWDREQWHEYRAAGDVDVWPFLRRGDYEQALG